MGQANFKQHFSATALKPIHDVPVLFVVSQWQPDKTTPGILYLIYRTAVVAFLLTTWVLSLSTPSYPIYLTNWGYTLVTLQAVFGFVLSLSTVCSKQFKADNIHDIFLKLYTVYWIIQQIAISLGFMITIIFWSVLWTAMDAPLTASNFFVHGSNSIIIFIDLWIIGHPIRLMHFIYPLLMGIVYAIFSIIYHFIDIERGGKGYIYFILDWNYPFQTILVVLGVALLIIVLHCFAFTIHLVKVSVHRRFFSGNVTESTADLSGEIYK